MKWRWHRAINVALALVMALGVSLSTLPAQAAPDPGWYDASWGYRRAITLSPATSVADYQVLVTLATATMGNPYLNVNSDGSDIRFTGSDGTTLQDYWIESWDNTGDSKIWVEVKTSGTSTIYMYYGNSGASSASDGDATFVFFDDFEAGNLNKWTTVVDTIWTIASDQAHSGTYSMKLTNLNQIEKVIVATGVNETDVLWEGWWRTDVLEPNDLSCIVRSNTTTPKNFYDLNMVKVIAWGEDNWVIAKEINDVWAQIAAGGASGWSINTWHKVTTIIQGTSMKGLMDDVQKVPSTGWTDVGTEFSSGSVGIKAYYTSATGSFWVDDCLARKYVSPEPSASVGIEESEETIGQTWYLSSEGWYDASWGYRRAITLSPATSVADYQVLVTLTAATMGNPYTNVNSDGSDIRFTGSDGTTLQDYWIESWDNTGDSKIWVEVKTSGTSTIYMYYGNSAASSASNGTATFIFFDDFESYALGSDGSPTWNFQGTGTGEVIDDGTGNQVYHITGSGRQGAMVNSVSISDGAWEGKMYYVTSTNNHDGLAFRTTTLVSGSIDTYVAQLRQNENIAQISAYNSGSWGGYIGNTYSMTLSTGVWYNLSIGYLGNNAYFYIDGSERCTTTSAIKTATGIGMFGWTGNVYFDEVRARKYNSLEPSASVGSEESSSYIMYKGDASKPAGTVTVADDGSQIWRADEAATVNVGFPAGTWTGHITFDGGSSDTTVRVYVGKWDGSDFTPSSGSEFADVSGSSDFSISASSFTVPETKWLACKIEDYDAVADSNSVMVSVGSNYSYVSSPLSDPGYPIPELPTIILIGIGLASLGAYFAVKRRNRRRASPADATSQTFLN